MTESATIDGTAEEINTTSDPGGLDLAPVQPAAVTTSTALARPVATDQVLMPLDTGQVVEGMKAYQRLLHDLLDPTDWQETNETEPDPQNPGRRRKKRFPKKSAYRKIARAFNLSFEVVSRTIDRAPDGRPLSAETVIRAVAPNGQYGDGDGYCAITEFTGRRANDPKLENSMRATATTRAKNRAISDLVGMGEVSAEEVVAAAPVADDQAAIPDASEKARENAQKSIALFLGDSMSPQKASAEAWKVIEVIEQDADARLSAHHANALVIAAKAVHSAQKAKPDATPEQEPLRQAPFKTHTDRMREQRENEEHDSTAKPAADPPPLDWMPEREAEQIPPAGTVQLDDPRAAELCICPNGLDSKPGETDTNCPIASHGIPF